MFLDWLGGRVPTEADTRPGWQRYVAAASLQMGIIRRSSHNRDRGFPVLMGVRRRRILPMEVQLVIAAMVWFSMSCCGTLSNACTSVITHRARRKEKRQALELSSV